MYLSLNPTMWAVAGLILLVLEALMPGIFLLFFGLGALTVALITWLVPGMAVWLQWMLFATATVLFVLALRNQIKKVFTGKRSANFDGLGDDFVGQRVVVKEAVRPPQTGKVELHGSLWVASAQEELSIGTVVTVTGRDGLTLTVTRS
jgi:membrane protein implicated in regulation of membrane protease activity